LDAFSGLIFVLALLDSTTKWVARLQLPFLHLMEGSGQAVQYHPEESSVPRLQPLHCSTIWLQIPPLYEHPFEVIKEHSMPFLIVAQFIGITPFRR